MLASVLFFSGIASLVASPASVIVIGGGPTGLGAAIEAKKSGSDVILVEKRGAYTRQNTLFLYTATVELLDLWNVEIPLMERLEFQGQRRGFVLIKDLEESLSTRVDELGVQRIQGEFIDFLDSHTAIVGTESGNKLFHYDVLVGADGAHSRVREKLGIESSSLGEALGGLAMVHSHNPEGKITAEIQSHVDIIAKKVCVPSATILFMQSQPDTSIQNLTINEMIRLAAEFGWGEEARKIEEGSLFEMENIPISLQHSCGFSDPERNVILLGDAAAVASFYQGTGANFSFKTTQLAKCFFASWPQPQAYEQFNRDMEIEVDGLIATSLPLFTKKSQFDVDHFIKLAKAFSNETSASSLKNEQESLCAYIVRILQSPEFQKDPQAYLAAWKERRGHTEEWRIPEDDALRFFDRHIPVLASLESDEEQ